MNAESPLRRHARAIVIIVAVLVVLGLAVPVGLARHSGAGGSASDASVAGVAPTQVERDAGTSAGSSGSALSTDSGAPAAQTPNGAKSPAGTVTSGATDALAGTKIARTAWIGLEGH